jgi:hypothetical protein
MVPDGVPTPAAFQFRYDFTTSEYKEEELSTHWIEFHGEERPTNLSNLAKFLTEPRIITERKIGKNDRFVIVSVDKIRSNSIVIEQTRTTLDCFHTPRVVIEPAIDSHSSIFPDPGVRKWPKPNSPEDVGAYQFAIQSYLSELAETATFKIRDLVTHV